MPASDLPRFCLTAFLIAVLIAPAAPTRAACDFAPVKQQIDNVLDKDAAKAAKFRREVSEGSDSIAMMEKLVAEDTREQLDICRFEAGEYLAKRGYPPFH
jgi:hypothetical protein